METSSYEDQHAAYDPEGAEARTPKQYGREMLQHLHTLVDTYESQQHAGSMAELEATRERLYSDLYQVNEVIRARESGGYDLAAFHLAQEKIDWAKSQVAGSWSGLESQFQDLDDARNPYNRLRAVIQALKEATIILNADWSAEQLRNRQN